MNESMVIQRLMLIASFLISLPYCAYVMWPKSRRAAVALGQTLLPQWPDFQSSKPLALADLRSAKEKQMLGTGGLGRPTAGWHGSVKTHASTIGDWLAPLIVWVLVIAMGMAVVGFLLGQR
jgi:hypothetical protein